MVKWLLTLIVVYFVYKWVKSKNQTLKKGDDQKSLNNEDEEYIEYEEVE